MTKSPSPQPPVEVLQCDREAAASPTLGRSTLPQYDADYIRSGKGDNHSLVQAFARHRARTAAPSLDGAITSLRGLCNEQIAAINQGQGARTPGFREINRLLKACDVVFTAAESGKGVGDV